MNDAQDTMPGLAPSEYWEAEAARYANNADYWRGRYEALKERCYGVAISVMLVAVGMAILWSWK